MHLKDYHKLTFQMFSNDFLIEKKYFAHITAGHLVPADFQLFII